MLNFSEASFFCQKTWGPDTRLIGSKSLRGGAANQGVFKHDTSSGVSFVEKRTTGRGEVLFAQSTLAKQNSGEKNGPTIPQIFDLIQRDEGFIIFMEHLNPLSKNFVDKKDSARNVARFINSLHKDLDRISNTTLQKAPDRSNHLDFVLEIFPQKYYREKKMLIEIKNRFDEEKKIISHNDLFFPNICFRGNSTKTLVAIDFALVGENLPGAELHHFLDRTDKKFFDDLVKEYALVSSLDQNLLIAGASLYSGFRSFSRLKEKNSIDERLRELKKSIILTNNALMV